jgi:hypothetical protein
MANKYVAIIEAADPHDLAQCPNPNVSVKVLPYNQVRLVGGYDDLMQVLTKFVGLTSAEADILISEWKYATQ